MSENAPEWKEYFPVDNFCPIKIHSSLEMESVVFQSLCPGKTKITLINLVYDYLNPDIMEIELPKELENFQNLELTSGNYIRKKTSLPLLFRRAGSIYPCR